MGVEPKICHEKQKGGHEISSTNINYGGKFGEESQGFAWGFVHEIGLVMGMAVNEKKVGMGIGDILES